ncbi:MAG: hypothetical protein O3A21_04695 [Proteobacteria bacterium]|nr:hypothetical protein [Pseudomonadota bacterium]
MWWGAGLAALLPGFLSRWLGIAPDLVILGIDADTFEVGAGRSGDLSEPLGRVARSDSDARL